MQQFPYLPQAAVSPSMGQLTWNPASTYTPALPAAAPFPGPTPFPGPVPFPGPAPLPGPAPFPHPAPAPFPGPPPIRPAPGPTALGPGRPQGSLGTGVAGVGIDPVATVALPPAAGGPHPLPKLPPLPVPQGFPDPIRSPLPSAQPPAAGGPPPFSPGTTTIIGPRGYMPGIGNLGPPEVPAAPQPSPFWSALAWHLLSSGAVRRTVGEELERLMESDDRSQLVQLATQILLTPEMQAAFRSLASGSLPQTPYTSLFGERLKAALAGRHGS